jgi:hypothetical protein
MFQSIRENIRAEFDNETEIFFHNEIIIII